MDQTTDTFIIVKSGQDATPLAGSSSLAFPGSGVGMPGCVIPPGEASEKGIAGGSSSLAFPGSGVGIPGCGVPLRQEFRADLCPVGGAMWGKKTSACPRD